MNEIVSLRKRGGGEGERANDLFVQVVDSERERQRERKREIE